MRTDQPGFAVAQVHVALGKLRSPFAQRLHFPAVQRKAGFKGFLDEVVVSRPLVLRDYSLFPCRAGRGFACLSHDCWARLPGAHYT